MPAPRGARPRAAAALPRAARGAGAAGRDAGDRARAHRDARGADQRARGGARAAARGGRRGPERAAGAAGGPGGGAARVPRDGRPVAGQGVRLARDGGLRHVLLVHVLHAPPRDGARDRGLGLPLEGGHDVRRRAALQPRQGRPRRGRREPLAEHRQGPDLARRRVRQHHGRVGRDRRQRGRRLAHRRDGLGLQDDAHGRLRPDVEPRGLGQGARGRRRRRHLGRPAAPVIFTPYAPGRGEGRASCPAGPGGVTNFVRKLVLGKSSNNANSTFTIRKLNCGSNPNNLNYVAQNTDGSVLTPMCPGALPGAVLVH